MNRITTKYITTLILSLLFANRVIAQPYPSYMAEYKDKEMSNVIYDLMPSYGDDKIKWDSNIENYIYWFPYNTESNNEIKERNGLIRINVLGEYASKPYPNNDQLSWKISLKSTTSYEEGVQYITLKPIGVNQEICFGDDYRNCSFSTENSLKYSNIKYSRICQSTSIGSSINILRLSTPSKPEITVAEITTWGSGGENTSLTIFIDKKSSLNLIKLCQER